MKTEHTEGQHTLGSIQKAQSFFGPETNRLQALTREHLRGGRGAPFFFEQALPDQRERQVRKGS
jgi:hypothetical protein